MPKKKGNFTPTKAKKPKVKKKRSEKQMEEDVGPLTLQKRPAVRTGPDKGEVDSKTLKALFADGIEEAYGELGAEIDRMNAVEKAWVIVGEARYKAGIRFYEDD